MGRGKAHRSSLMSLNKVTSEMYYNWLRPFGGSEPAGEIILEALVEEDDIQVPHEASGLRAAFIAYGFGSAGLTDGTQCVAKMLEEDVLLVFSGTRKAFPFGLHEPLRFAVLWKGEVVHLGECGGFDEAIRLDSLRGIEPPT